MGIIIRIVTCGGQRSVVADLHYDFRPLLLPYLLLLPSLPSLLTSSRSVSGSSTPRPPLALFLPTPHSPCLLLPVLVLVLHVVLLVLVLVGTSTSTAFNNVYYHSIEIEVATPL
jgi:hypothetical protein